MIENEIAVEYDGFTYTIRFDWDPGERAYFNPITGAGSPGYGPAAHVYEVNAGAGWRPAEIYAPAVLDSFEEQAIAYMQGEAAEREAVRAEYEYDAAREDRLLEQLRADE